MSHVPSPAGFWKRYVAYFIDFMLVTTVLNIVSTPLLLAAILRPESVLYDLARRDALGVLDAQQALATLLPELLWMTAASTLLYVVLAAAYFIGMEASARQATLGKQLLGLKVTAFDGSRPGAGRVAGRFFAAGLSWLTLNVGHALAGWTRERRALHDYLAGTRVVLVDPADAAMPAWGKAVIALNVLGLLAVFGVSMLLGMLLALRPAY